MPLSSLNYNAYHTFYEDKLQPSTDEIRKFFLSKFFELIVQTGLI